MVVELLIRPAKRAERCRLEALQLRASLRWEEYRSALLAHPDAVALPIEQILDGRTYVAERQGELVGFSVVLLRADGNAELDGLFLSPRHGGQGSAGGSFGRPRVSLSAQARRFCAWSPIRVPKASTRLAALSSLAKSKLVSV
jgi:hypothetical protein